MLQSDREQGKASPRLGAAFLACATLLVALSVRLWRIDTESAWIDEAYSIALARCDLIDIVRGAAADQHPPLYHLLLHFWLTGLDSVAGARLLSASLGVVLVAQAMFLGRQLRGRALGLLGGAFLAISPMGVWYSQEARMYLLLAVLGTAATTELWLCLNGARKRHWALYALFSLLSLYTHYLAAFLLLTHGLTVLIWSAGRRAPRIFSSWAAGAGAAALCFLPWVPVAADQSRHHAVPWVARATAALVRDTWFQVLAGVPLSLVAGELAWPAFAAIAAGAVYLSVRRPDGPDASHAFEFLALQAIVPLLALAAASPFVPVFEYKQLIIVLLPHMLLAGWLLSSLPSPWLRIGALSAFGGVLMAATVVQPALLQKDDWRSVAGLLAKELRPGDRVYCNPAAGSLALSLYLPQPPPVTFDGYPPSFGVVTGGWAGGRTITPEIANRVMKEAARGCQRIWLVEFLPSIWDPGRLLERWLASRGSPTTDRSLTRLRVRSYELRREESPPVGSSTRPLADRRRRRGGARAAPRQNGPG